MAINAATAVTDASAGAAAMKKSTGMNKDDFLKLFITQMQHQDPLKPMDGTQLIGQLAQLTQVEQAYNTNSNLQSLLTAQNSSNTLSAVSFLGTTATAKGANVQLTSGAQPTIYFNLGSRADSVAINITDSTGNVVRTITTGAANQGVNSAIWDGTGNTGQPLSPGFYGFNVLATANGTEVNSAPLIQGKVDGVALDGEMPTVYINGISFPITDIISVKGA